MPGKILCRNFLYIPKERVIGCFKICCIGFPRILIPFAGRDTFPPYTFKAFSHPANTGKKVYKCEGIWLHFLSLKSFLRYILKHLYNGFTGNRFSPFPSLNSPNGLVLLMVKAALPVSTVTASAVWVTFSD